MSGRSKITRIVFAAVLALFVFAVSSTADSVTAAQIPQPASAPQPALPYDNIGGNFVISGYAGQPVTTTIYVRNDTEAVLNLSVMDAPDAAFTIEGLPAQLQVDERMTFSITCTPNGGPDVVSRTRISMIFGDRELRANHTLVCATAGETIGIFRPEKGLFALRYANTAGNSQEEFAFGQQGDLPMVGDWDGDGVDTVGVYREGTFYLLSKHQPQPELAHQFAFGQAGDLPVAGDWDGDGMDSIGVFRPSTQQFMLRNSLTSGLPDYFITFGAAGDLPVAGDWDGDGKDSVGVYRQPEFFTSNTMCASCVAELASTYTLKDGAYPVVGDWDNNGTDDFGVLQSGFGYGRHLLRFARLDTMVDVRFGAETDIPIAGRWVAAQQQ